jgi:glycosyltransferase involved in cell wall biosynthesis
LIETHEPGKDPVTRRVTLPFRPPYTYPLDLVVPRRAPAVDGWFGFNSLAAARGLMARRRHRADTVVYWCVDFVPERFGRGPLTRTYDALDRLCSTHADARFELSEAALEGRNDRHGIPTDELAPARVVPMGAWLERVRTTEPEGHRARRVVFLGHLVPRQGVGLLLEALAQLDDVEGDIIGRGPLEADLRREAERLGLGDRLRFHGFVDSYREVEQLLSRASIAIAPYEPTEDSFSRFADPGKLKGYLAAGLPIMLTDVPPNARDLEQHGGAEIVPFSPEALAAAIRKLLAAPDEWKRRRADALALARDFDWPMILEPALTSVGFAL